MTVHIIGPRLFQLHRTVYSNSMSCVLCHRQHKSCDHDGTSCSLCRKLGKECVLREKVKKRKPRKPRAKRRRVGGASGNASGDALGPPGIPDTHGNMFSFSQFAHNTLMQTLSSLPSSHFGLQCGVKWLFQLAKARANWWLMAAVSWLATSTGLGGGTFVQANSAVKQLHVSSFGLPSFLVRHHNETAGTGEWNTRVIFATNSEHTQHGSVYLSTRFDEMFGSLPGLKENIVKPSVHAPEYLVSKILEESTLRRFFSSGFDIVKKYVSPLSGPFINVVLNSTLMTSEGPVKGIVYLTFWFGTHGLDACEIFEFVEVPVEEQEETNDDSEVAASILNLLRS